MVPTQELTKEEVLERLCKILKGVSVVPLRADEFTAENPPLAVSLFLSYMYFSSLLNLLMLILVVCRSGGGTLMICLRYLRRTTLVGLEKAGTRGPLLG
jgi:hypothetical protein